MEPLTKHNEFVRSQRTKLAKGQILKYQCDNLDLQPRRLSTHFLENYSSFCETHFRNKVADFESYVVKAGDTLQRIATRRLGSSRDWPLLYCLNASSLAHFDLIRIGQRLDIPADSTR